LSVPVFLLLCIGLLRFDVAYGSGQRRPLPDARDRSFRDGWNLLEQERYAEARAAFAAIPPAEYDLGDYVLYFSGTASAREKRRGEAAGALKRLEELFPRSPLVPYLQHEIAFAAALDNDLPAAREAFAVSRGKVTGNGRKAEEGFVAARLAGGGEPTEEAARLHLENFSSYPAQPAAALSYERLWTWWKEGRLSAFDLPPGFHAKLGKAIWRAGDAERARAVYDYAVSRYQPSDGYYSLVLDYAEFLRKMGETAVASALLAQRFEDALPAFRADVQFLKARVDWKAGKLEEARRGFLAVSSESPRFGTVERARYNAAWILMDEGDRAGSTEAFGELRLAADERVRQEAVFRYAYGLYRQRKYDEAVAAFRAGERGGFGDVEVARHRFWGARALRESGHGEEADRILAALAADPSAGIYALLALRDRGGDAFRMFNSRSSGETGSCGMERLLLWEKIRGAEWKPGDAEKVRRAERLSALGVPSFAVLEAQRVDRTAARKMIGLDETGASALFRYLAGDLRGAIRESASLPPGEGPPGLVDRIRYPLAPEYLGDCDSPQSGVDPLVLHAIIRQESSFQADVLSPAGAVGLMQLMPGTAAATARREDLPRPRRIDLTRPSLNVRLGASYFARLLKRFDGDYFRAVAAYNGGESAVNRWWAGSGGDPAVFLERISYQETRFYLRRIFLNLLQYYRIYRPEMFARYLPSAAAEAPKAPDAAPIRTPPAAGAPAEPAPETAPSGEQPPTGPDEM